MDGDKKLELLFTLDEKKIYLRWEMVITPIHILLFLSTFLTTTVAGAMVQGIFPLSTEVWRGLLFSAPLLFILSCHEFGHIWAMYKYAVKSTFPFFIPAPNIVGTFGAIMVLRERVDKSSQIVKIGAAGPICGFLAALPIAILGLKLSQSVNFAREEEGMGFIKLGSSLIFYAIQKLIFGDIEPNSDILLHPVAFAGWIGFFITAINLIPIGQTDGGHIVFGLFQSAHRILSFTFVILLFILGILFWWGWTFWAVLTALLGLRKIPYEPIKDITITEKLIGLTALFIFIITFMLAPIEVKI